MLNGDIFNNSFINLIFIGIIALFPVINPLGSAFLISPYLKNLPLNQKKNAVKKITFYAFSFCVSILFVGPFILQAFGITISIIQLGGGIMICKTGWDFLNSDAQQITESTLNKHITEANIIDKLFYPITFPITTGAGTISVLLTLSAHTQAVTGTGYYLHSAAILISITFICAMIYVCYLNVRRLLHFLGPHGEDVVKRICAFLIFCVGLQIAFTGLLVLIKI
ncbi:multiple antibiotic resistance (MarC)-like protein [Flavobacterium rivuli WB 3.3-2 = DSM 21788]|uniref:UPF0056 membrane protein n=1 Tax=Flavobacterium rivuli WB 3.3-2 = DSM 21788 TaxID=1121895 RepID=A0A0A2M5A9_9FLAO|nr:MarC family protein [Flavobacterium rivuli]KGO86623.1 multiple antibiotic resistance (MarC)-like protein [Flavobacterium rivuli WB 3.3-2 = DSM 21788]